MPLRLSVRAHRLWKHINDFLNNEGRDLSVTDVEQAISVWVEAIKRVRAKEV